MVVDVCTNRGDWIDVFSNKPYETIDEKVDDGFMVFSITAEERNESTAGENG